MPVTITATSVEEHNRLRAQVDELTDRVEALERSRERIVTADSGSRDDIMRAAESFPDVIRVPAWQGLLHGTIELPDTISLIAQGLVVWRKAGDGTEWDHPLLRVIATGTRRPWRWAGFEAYGTGADNGHPDIGALGLGALTVRIWNVRTSGFGRAGITLRGPGRGGIGQPGQPHGVVWNYRASRMGYHDGGRLRLGYGLEQIGVPSEQVSDLDMFTVEDCVGTDCRHFYTQVNGAYGRVRHCAIAAQPELSHAIDAHGETPSWQSSELLIAHHNRVRSGESEAMIVVRGGRGILHDNDCDIPVSHAYIARNEGTNPKPTPGAKVWYANNRHRGVLSAVHAENGAETFDGLPANYEALPVPHPLRSVAN